MNKRTAKAIKAIAMQDPAGYTHKIYRQRKRDYSNGAMRWKDPNSTRSRRQERLDKPKGCPRGMKPLWGVDGVSVSFRYGVPSFYRRFQSNKFLYVKIK